MRLPIDLLTTFLIYFSFCSPIQSRFCRFYRPKDCYPLPSVSEDLKQKPTPWLRVKSTAYWLTACLLKVIAAKPLVPDTTP